MESYYVSSSVTWVSHSVLFLRLIHRGAGNYTLSILPGHNISFLEYTTLYLCFLPMDAGLFLILCSDDRSSPECFWVCFLGNSWVGNSHPCVTCAGLSLSAQVGSMDLSSSESIRYYLSYFSFKVSLDISSSKSSYLVPLPPESAC